MKKEKIAGIALAVVNIVLAAAGIVLHLGADRKEPSFEFQAMDIIYEEGMDTSKLLEGINAYDNEDGDITDKIVIEKLIENRESDSVVVIYGVSDKAGNVAKCSREFAAVFKEGREEEKPEDETEVQDGWLMQSGFWTELEGKDGAGDEAEGDRMDGDGTGGDEAAENGTEGNGIAGDKEEENGAAGNGAGNNNPAEDRTEGNNAAGENAANEADAENSQDEDEENDQGADGGNAQRADGGNAEGRQGRNTGNRNAPDPEAPVLALKVTEVKTSVGAGPAWVEIIGMLSDDKDGYETLFRNLEVSKYDKNQPGTYEVTVSTKDSDGNRSQTIPLTIIVK